MDKKTNNEGDFKKNMNNTFEKQILDLTAQAAEIRARSASLEAEKLRYEAIASSADAALNTASEAKAIQKATNDLANARARVDAISGALQNANGQVAQIEAQKRALQREHTRCQNLDATAQHAFYGVQLHEEFEAILAQLEATIIDGFQRLNTKRNEQRAAREDFERAVLATDSALAHSYASTIAEGEAAAQRGFTFRQEMAKRGVDERVLSLALRGEGEPHAPVLSQWIAPFDLPRDTHKGVVADLLAKLKEARDSVKSGRPSDILTTSGANRGSSYTAPISTLRAGPKTVPFTYEPSNPHQAAGDNNTPVVNRRREEKPWIRERS